LGAAGINIIQVWSSCQLFVLWSENEKGNALWQVFRCDVKLFRYLLATKLELQKIHEIKMESLSLYEIYLLHMETEICGGRQ
jgi:Ni,Fe-hydrogenase I cytochrome b subunit